MHQNAKEQKITRTGYEVVKIVDGDGLIVRNIFTKKEEEIRLYGIDAPEIKKCSKLTQDEMIKSINAHPQKARLIHLYANYVIL